MSFTHWAHQQHPNERGQKRFRGNQPIEATIKDGKWMFSDSNMANGKRRKTDKLGEIGDMINDSQQFTRSENSANIGRKMQNNGDEIPVVPIPSRVSLAAPDYFTIDLPYEVPLIYQAARNLAGNTARIVRLNSIFDPDESSGGTKQPMGRDTWASIYNYYRVLKSSVSFHILNANDRTLTATNRDTVIAGLEWTDDTTATGTAQTVSAFQEEKQSITQMLPGAKEAPANLTTMSYTYSPQSWDYHVEGTGIEERWTPIGSDPAQTHRLALRFFPFASSDTGNYDIEYVMRIVYTVQFREAKYGVIQEED